MVFSPDEHHSPLVHLSLAAGQFYHHNIDIGAGWSRRTMEGAVPGVGPVAWRHVVDMEDLRPKAVEDGEVLHLAIHRSALDIEVIVMPVAVWREGIGECEGGIDIH